MTNGTSAPTPSQPVQPSSMPAKPGPSGRAIAALIMGIASLVCCGFLVGIPAIIIGKMEMNAIKEGKANKEGNTMALVGFILGIAGTVISCLMLIGYIVIIALGISTGTLENAQ